MQKIKELEKQNLTNKTVEIQLSEENFYLKEEVNSLKEKIGQLENSLKSSLGELHTKEKVLQYVRKEYNDRVKKIQKQFEKKKEDLVEKQLKDQERLLEREMKNCQSFEEKLQEIEEKRQAEVNIYQSNFQQVKALVCLLYTSPSPRDRG